MTPQRTPRDPPGASRETPRSPPGRPRDSPGRPPGPPGSPQEPPGPPPGPPGTPRDPPKLLRLAPVWGGRSRVDAGREVGRPSRPLSHSCRPRGRTFAGAAVWPAPRASSIRRPRGVPRVQGVSRLTFKFCQSKGPSFQISFQKGSRRPGRATPSPPPPGPPGAFGAPGPPLGLRTPPFRSRGMPKSAPANPIANSPANPPA